MERLQYLLAASIIAILLAGGIMFVNRSGGETTITRHVPETAVHGETIRVTITMDINEQTTNLSITDRAGNTTVIEAPGGVTDGPFVNWFIDSIGPTRQNLTYRTATPITGTAVRFNGSFEAVGYNGTITGDQEVVLQ